MIALTHRRAILSSGQIAFVVSCIVVLFQLRSFEIASLIAFGAYVLVGTLIAVRRPDNLLGLLLVAYGAVWGLVTAGYVTAESLDEAGHLESASWVSLVAAVLSVPMFWVISAMWLLFPDGRTHSVLARKLLGRSGVFALAMTAAAVFAKPQVLPEIKSLPHPFLNNAVADAIYVGLTPGIVMFFLFGYAVAVMLIVRMRRGDPIERRQARWVAVAILANATILIANVSIAPLGTDDRAFLLIDAVAVVLIPLAMAVAIFKYRLYDIDTVINRSVTFAALSAFIAGGYVTVVVGIGQFVGGATGYGISVFASVLVAMAFQPVRRRVQRWANRLVYGERATPYEVLVRFSRRSAELSDEELLLRVPQLIVDGTGATTSTLWTRKDDGFTTAASWPDGQTPRHLTGHSGFVDPEADHSIPVFHDGDLLGGLSLVKPRGETITPTERALLADLAAGMGLALRNARLTGELRRQVAQLEASRERVLAASDAARRSLENDLDSGPQQTLVAVKVKLGPTRKRAEQAGVDKLATLLAQLEIEAGEAIRSVREFAGGIYPPLLEAEGLETAIGQQARKSPIPVSIRGTGVKRYPREIEAAVYFSILEALQNTNKYSDASSASVTLFATNGSLTFEVQDDGLGFDTAATTNGAGLTGMVDRLDTIGGTVRVTSSPNAGTQITGSVPIRQLVKT